MSQHFDFDVSQCSPHWDVLLPGDTFRIFADGDPSNKHGTYGRGNYVWDFGTVYMIISRRNYMRNATELLTLSSDGIQTSRMWLS